MYLHTRSFEIPSVFFLNLNVKITPQFHFVPQIERKYYLATTRRITTRRALDKSPV